MITDSNRPQNIRNGKASFKTLTSYQNFHARQQLHKHHIRTSTQDSSCTNIIPELPRETAVAQTSYQNFQARQQLHKHHTRTSTQDSSCTNIIPELPRKIAVAQTSYQNFHARQYLHKHHARTSTEDSNCTNIIPELPRKTAVAQTSYQKTAVAQFRLTTGHDCLAKHLHKINILSTPRCILCNHPKEEMDDERLNDCATVKEKTSKTSKYWRARLLMTSVLDTAH
ncbi:hypothetical protein L9F63_002325 [Diploptera punctata]|uniref:Uncharacterized protein n=1 Tax=Diploptera punctata TaxID=6984 RepID=A0AAD8A249_DIPPU|nr:hypothetical protein L9F63_002325 [Diploptera punctata]